MSGMTLEAIQLVLLLVVLCAQGGGGRVIWVGLRHWARQSGWTLACARFLLSVGELSLGS